MLTIPPPKFRKHGRPRSKRVKAPAALTLVAAAFNADEFYLTLTFDRAIDIAAIDVGQFHVFDGVFNNRSYVGDGTATLQGPAIVRVNVTELGATGAGSVTMSAGAENGIVAEDDGGTWAGVENLTLPFAA